MDHIIALVSLGIFLLANLIVGLRASRGIKTMDSYALGDKSIGLGPLIATLFATLLTSDRFISTIRGAYYRGIVSYIYAMNHVLGAFLVGWFVFPKMTRFKNKYTLGDIMHSMYGGAARVFTVVVSSLFSLLVIVSQLKAFGEIGALFGFASSEFIILLGLIITVYTSLGGIRSVTATDVLQFALIVISFITFFLLVVGEKGGIFSTIGRIPKDSIYLKFWSHEKLFKRIPLAFAASCFPTVLISPPVIQRVLMTSKKRDIRSMFTSFSVLYSFMIALMIILGLFLFVDNNQVYEPLSLGKMITRLCSNSIGVYFFLLGLCAVFMSTMDSYLNSMAIMWAHDIVNPMMPQKEKKTNTVLLSKAIALFCGLICTFLATKIDFTITEISNYARILLSSITLPFLAGVIGIKVNKKSFWINVVLFLLIFAIPILVHKYGSDFAKRPIENLLNFLRLKKSDAVGTIFLVSFATWSLLLPLAIVLFFVIHIIQYGGLTIIKPKGHLALASPKRSLADDLMWLRSPVQWADQKASNYGIAPRLFGVFTVATSIIYYIGFNTSMALSMGIVALKGISILLCSALLSKSLWPKRIQRYYNVFYFVCVLFCVPLVGMFTSLADPTSMFTSMNVVLYMVLLATLVDWRTFLLFQSIGSLLAILLYRSITGVWIPDFPESQGWFFLFSMVYTSFIILVFLRKKQLVQQQQSYELSRDNRIKRQTIQTHLSIQQQLTSTLDKQSSMMTLISELTEKIQADKQVSAKSKDYSKRIASAVKDFQDKAMQSKEWLPLQVKPFSVQKLLRQVVQETNKLGISLDDDLVIVKESSMEEMKGDIAYLTRLLVNSVVYAKQFTQDTVHIYLGDSTMKYELGSKYNPIKVAGMRFAVGALAELPTLPTVYDPFGQEGSLLDIQSLEMVHNLRVVQAHYGMTAHTTTSTDGQLLQTYVVPTDLKALRPKIALFAKEDMMRQTDIGDDIDQVFLRKVRDRGLLEYDLIEQALRACKHYHKGQTRKSLEPFYTHPVTVATILLDYTDDPNIIIAGLLQDTVEDTPYTLRQMEASFGYEVALIVDEVTHLYNRSGRNMNLDKSESLQSLFATQNPKSLLVKLADRVHNMRTLGAKQRHRQLAIAQETLDFFVPVAQQLKIKPLEEELKKVANKFL